MYNGVHNKPPVVYGGIERSIRMCTRSFIVIALSADPKGIYSVPDVTAPLYAFAGFPFTFLYTINACAGYLQTTGLMVLDKAFV